MVHVMMVMIQVMMMMMVLQVHTNLFENMSATMEAIIQQRDQHDNIIHTIIVIILR